MNKSAEEQKQNQEQERGGSESAPKQCACGASERVDSEGVKSAQSPQDAREPAPKLATNDSEGSEGVYGGSSSARCCCSDDSDNRESGSGSCRDIDRGSDSVTDGPHATETGTETQAADRPPDAVLIESRVRECDLLQVRYLQCHEYFTNLFENFVDLILYISSCAKRTACAGYGAVEGGIRLLESWNKSIPDKQHNVQ